MKYKITAVIRDPKTKQGMSSDIVMKLNVAFAHDPNTYGNGYYVNIEGDRGFENTYDLRYDKSFHKDAKEVWLAGWAYSYWSGKNGAYEVKSLTIEKA